MNNLPAWTRLTPEDMARVAAYAERLGLRRAALDNNVSRTAVRRACVVLGIVPKAISPRKQSKEQRVAKAMAMMKPILRHLALTMADVFPNKHTP